MVLLVSLGVHFPQWRVTGVDEFQAGSLGLNLSCASQVFLMDPWWQAYVSSYPGAAADLKPDSASEDQGTNLPRLADTNRADSTRSDRASASTRTDARVSHSVRKSTIAGLLFCRVKVYRMVAADTIEAYVAQIKDGKKQLILGVSCPSSLPLSSVLTHVRLYWDQGNRVRIVVLRASSGSS